jgi:hypothetical protein
MSCVSPTSGVLACGVRGGPYTRALRPCPFEDGRVRRMLVSYAGLMYGDDVTCLGCGAEKQDGVWVSHDEWRTERTEKARQRWRLTISPQVYSAYVQAQFDAFIAETDADLHREAS